jgi:RHS repeat-associated protein
MSEGPAGEPGTVTYLHSDHLGSISLATDTNGVEVPGGRRGFYPYGGLRYGSLTNPTDRAFTGQRVEPDLGLYDYRSRFYDPTLARFISPDTIVPNPGNPQDLNRYAYVGNNPVRYADPNGHAKRVTPSPPSEPSEENKSIFGWMWKGLRFEGTYWVLPVVAVDANLDFVGDIYLCQEDSYGLPYFLPQGKVFITIGPQVGFGEFGSANAGPIFTNADLEEYGHITNHAGGTFSDDIFLGIISSEAGGLAALLGLEGDYGWRKGEEFLAPGPHSVFVGIMGVGEEASVWAGRHVFEIEIDAMTEEMTIGVLGHILVEGNLEEMHFDLTVPNSEPH